MTTQQTLNGKTLSIFDTRGLDTLHYEIQEVYLGDNRPWVIGYSGGKIQQLLSS